MMRWAVILLVVAALAAVFDFADVASVAMWLARVALFVFAVAFSLFFLDALVRRCPAWPGLRGLGRAMPGWLGGAAHDAFGRTQEAGAAVERGIVGAASAALKPLLPEPEGSRRPS